MKSCNRCGYMMPNEAQICPNCKAPANTGILQAGASPSYYQQQPNQSSQQNQPLSPQQLGMPNQGIYPNSPINPYQQPPRKSKLPIVIISVVSAVILVSILAISMVTSSIRKFDMERGIDDITNSILEQGALQSDLELTDAYSIHGLYFKMPNTAMQIEDESLTRGAIFLVNTTAFQISYSEAQLVSKDEFLEGNLDYYRTLSFVEEVGEPVPVIVNGESWMKSTITCTEYSDYEGIELYLYHEMGRQYSIAILYSDITAREESEAVLSSVTFTSIEGAKDLSRASEFASGEDFDIEATTSMLHGDWAGGIAGHMIFNQDGTFEWFSSSEKDENNVFRGTYRITEPLIDIVSGEQNGFVLEMVYSEVIIEGTINEINPENVIRLYEFYETGENSYRIEDLATVSHYNFEKIV